MWPCHGIRASTRTLLLAIALIAVGLAVFWPGLHGWFVFDDHANLVTAEHWKVTSLDWRQWERAFASDISGATGRPLAMGSFALNYYFNGLDPFWLKVGNLSLHLLNGLLIWRLCLRIFGLLPYNQRVSIHVAWVVALIWVVHPLHVSTVMYIVQRMEIGATTGTLLALLAYVIGRSRQINGNTAWPWFVMAPTAALIGLGFKETAILAPGFAFLIELTVLRFRSAATPTSDRWKITWAAIIFVALALYFFTIAPQIKHWPYGIRNFSPTDRLLTQFPVLIMYIQQILVPLPESMRFYYDNFPVSYGLLQPPWTAVSAGIIFILATSAVVAFKRFPLVTLGVGWFFMGHALTSNLWPLELAFEHRNYLAILGLLLALIQPVHFLVRRFNTDAVVVMLALPALLLISLCNLQARTWGDPMQLAWTLENRNPGSPRANYDLASQLLIAAHDDPNSPFWSMARKQFEHGVSADHPSPLSLQGLLLMHGRAGIEPPAQYWDLLRKSLSAQHLHGERSGALHAITACQIQGRCAFNLTQMLDTFIVVTQHNSDSPVAYTLYANFAWNVLDDKNLAIELQRDAANLGPSNPTYRIALAKFLLASQDKENRIEGRALIRQLHEENRAGQLDRDLKELEELARRIES